MKHFNRLLQLGSGTFDKRHGAKLQLRVLESSSSSSSSFRRLLNSSRSFSSSSAAAVNSRRSSLAERMGKASTSDSSNISISGNKISNSGGSSSSSSKVSTKPPVVAKYNESYLKTWLGNDMPGQSYLQQMVAASKMKIQTAREANAGNGEKIENPMKELIRMREQSSEHANVEALDTPTSSSQAQIQIQQQAQASSLHQYNNSICSSSTLGQAMYEFTSLTIDLTQTWESASKQVSIELPKNTNDESVILEIVNSEGTGTGIGNNLLESREAFLVKIIDLVESKGYKILGINGLPMNLRDAVLSKGIHIISSPSVAKFDINCSSQDNQQENKEEGGHEVEEQQSTEGLVSKFYQGTVRSGQQVYAQKTGLIILGGVNDGGEVLADGDIHVYGALSGRVIAGLGSANARDSKIFIRQFRPSLIGIGDAFIIPDDHTELKRFRDKSVIVSLLCESTASNSNAPVFDSSCVKVGCEDGNFLIFTPL